MEFKQSNCECMKGVSSEAVSLAGQLELGKLIYLFSDNHVTLFTGGGRK
jgi:transketolase